AVGYSRGAGVLPFMVNRMTQKWRDRVTMLALVGLDRTIDFEVRPFEFLRRDASPAEVPVRAEVERVGKRILCFYGEHEKDSLCLDLPASVVVAIAELSHGRSGIGAGHDAMTGRGAAAFSRVGTPVRHRAARVPPLEGRSDSASP